jgi:hypothetical protein
VAPDAGTLQNGPGYEDRSAAGRHETGHSLRWNAGIRGNARGRYQRCRVVIPGSRAGAVVEFGHAVSA